MESAAIEGKVPGEMEGTAAYRSHFIKAEGPKLPRSYGVGDMCAGVGGATRVAKPHIKACRESIAL
eukprot:1140115-Pelagomonas_calceolata.AAC.13